MPLPLLAAPWVGSAIAWILSGLIWLFKSKLGYFIGAAMLWMGITLGTTEFLVEPLMADLQAKMEGSASAAGEYGALAVGWLGVVQFDRCCTMVVSAVIAKHSVLSGRLALFKRGVGAPAAP